MKLGCGREAIGEAARLAGAATYRIGEAVDKLENSISEGLVKPAANFLFGDEFWEHDMRGQEQEGNE